MEGKVANMEINANKASLRVKDLEAKLKESEKNAHKKVSDAIQSAKKESEEENLRLQTRIRQLEKQIARQRYLPDSLKWECLPGLKWWKYQPH